MKNEKNYCQPYIEMQLDRERILKEMSQNFFKVLLHASTFMMMKIFFFLYLLCQRTDLVVILSWTSWVLYKSE